MSNRRADLAAHAVLAVVAAAAVAPLVAGQVLYYGDITLQFVPWRHYAAQQLTAGRLPLWVQGVYGGLPFLANDQSAVLYPLWWLLLPLAPARQVALGCLVHLYLGAAGMFTFARLLGHRRAAALIAGLAFGAGGFVLSKQQFPSLSSTLAWLPWLFWGAERLCREPGPRRAAALALLIGVQWLAGHAQASLLALGLLLAWLALGRERRPGRWPWLAGALALGTAVGLVQLLPTYELLLGAGRGELDYQAGARFCQPPWQWPMWLWPQLYGAPQSRLSWLGVGPYWEQLAYVGLTTLPLAVAGCRGQRFWGWAIVVSLLLAAGRYLPLYGWLWHALPPLRQFHDPSRFHLFAVVALALLAARGAEAEPAPALRTIAWLSAASGVMLLLTLAPLGAWERAARWVLDQSPTKTVADLAALATVWRAEVARQMLVALLLLGAEWWLLRRPTRRLGLCGLVALDLLIYGFGLNPTTQATAFAGDPRPAELHGARRVWIPSGELERLTLTHFNLARYGPPRVAEVRRGLVANTALGWPLEQLGGYDPLRPRRVADWLESLETLPLAEADRRLAELGLDGRWSSGRWHAYRVGRQDAGARVIMERRSPQRWTAAVTGADEIRLWQAPIGGWRVSIGRLIPGGTPLETIWRPDAQGSIGRCWYAPLALRLGGFVALLGLAAVAGLLALRHKNFTDWLAADSSASMV